MPPPIAATFVGGSTGPWRVEAIEPYRGGALAAARRLDVRDGLVAAPDGVWALRGVTSNHRYTTRAERGALEAVQAGLGRAEATRASLIPITKSDAWWALAQDERRAIFEESSHHIAASLRYLPAIARRLHHGRDLPGEPFDFLTWFEYAPGDAAAFDELVAMLRATEEWAFVEREVHVRLVRE